jgi:hypothetical protein
MYKMKAFSFLLLGLLFLGKADAYPIHAKTDAHLAQPKYHGAVVVVQNPLECDACLLLANGLNQTVLHNPKVISTVTSELEKICQVLPASVQQLCITAADQAAPNLLNHLGDMIATEGCSDLGICHSKLHPHHP